MSQFELRPCTVCGLLDGDYRPKKVSYCSVCDVWLCQKDVGDVVRRAVAAYKRHTGRLKKSWDKLKNMKFMGYGDEWSVVDDAGGGVQFIERAVAGQTGIFVRQMCTAKNQTSSSSSWVVSCPNTVAGDEIDLFVFANTTETAPTCSDGVNSYVLTTSSSSTTFMFTAVNIVGGSITATITMPTQLCFGTVIGFQLANIPSSSFDGATTDSASQSSSSTWSGPNHTLSNANSILIYCGGIVTTNHVYTAGAGYTIPAVGGQVSGGSQSGFCEYGFPGVGVQTPTVTLDAPSTGYTWAIGRKP